MPAQIDTIRNLVRDIKDFPKPGILFKDITPLLADFNGFKTTIELLTAPFADAGITKVAGMESRGFIFGIPVAQKLNAGFIPIRKPGKLPHKTISEEFSLEYGTDSLEVHQDAATSSDRILIVDDLLATGGTAAATVKLIERLGATVAGIVFVIELDFLNGRNDLKKYSVNSLLHF